MRDPATSPATDFSIALLGEFVRLGVRDVVLSPGSRSQALALVCAELERVGAVRLHVRIDERVAGFLALGLAVESGLPVLLVTTSGTATANLHPAVLEGSHSRVPMILLTADRPAELRGIRANQTTVQPDIYGSSVRLARDVAAPGGETGEADAAAELARVAMAAAAGVPSGLPGPVHLNLAFRDPLSAPVADLSALASAVLDGRAGRDGRVGPPEPYRPSTSSGTDSSVPDSEVSIPPTAETSVGSAAPWQASAEIAPGPRTVVIAGHGAGPAAEAFARAGGWPLLAEVSSGARFGPGLVVAYRELLAHPDFGGRVQRAIVFGHPTLSREIPALIGRPDVETVVVNPAGTEFYNPGGRVSLVTGSVVAGSVVAAASGSDLVSGPGRSLSLPPVLSPAEVKGPARDWLGRWVFASRRILDSAVDADAEPAPDVAASRSGNLAARSAFVRTELAVARRPVTRRMLVDAVWRASWPHDRLVLGASRLIREADLRVPGKKIPVHANRGLAGIDGTVATAVGIALTSQATAGPAPAAPGVTRVLLGDLALLHDVGALLFGEGETRPRIQVIVGNDGGGTIFDGLEVAASASADAIARVLYTPQQVDLASLAAAYGWSYARAGTRGELDRALTTTVAGPSILEVPLPR